MPTFDDSLLYPSFHYSPQRFDGVQLRAIWRHEHEFKVEIFCQLCHILRVMARVIVKHYEDLLVWVGKGLPKGTQERHNVLLVG